MDHGTKHTPMHSNPSPLLPATTGDEGFLQQPEREADIGDIEPFAITLPEELGRGEASCNPLAAKEQVGIKSPDKSRCPAGIDVSVHL